jgi:aspartate aminotransferase-like enzyme
VSSLGAVPIETDVWGVDVLISSSHKALMTPPGVAIVIASPAALKAASTTSLPRFYLDWSENLIPQSRDEPETWFSATTSLIVGLEAALSLLRSQGFATVYQRHVELGRQCRSGVEAMGLTLFSPDDDRAAVLTAVQMPSGVDSTAVVQAMHDRWNVTVGDGEARLNGKIVRIGHLGYISEVDVELALAALGAAIAEVGVREEGVA